MSSYWTEKTWEYENGERMARAAEAALAAELVRQQRAERRALREQRRRERAAARGRRHTGPATLRQVLHLPR